MDGKTGTPTDERWQRAALGLLAAILVTAPLFFFTETRDQFELPKQLLLRALSSLWLGLLLAWRLRVPGQGWRRGPLDWPVLAWAACEEVRAEGLRHALGQARDDGAGTAPSADPRAGRDAPPDIHRSRRALPDGGFTRAEFA